MTNKKKKSVYWKIRFFLGVMFIASLVIVAVFPFSNRNLLITFVDEHDQEYEITFNNIDIQNRECEVLELPKLTEDVIITGIKIYGSSKTMRLTEIDFSRFFNYLQDADASNAVWTEKGIQIYAADEQKLYMRDSFVDEIQSISASFFQERLLLMGALCCLMLLLMILVTVVEDWKSEDNWDNHSPLYEFKKFVIDMKKYSQYMYYAAKTDLKAEVANSYLNRLWWLLEPFFNMLVYVIVFGKLMGNSIENYATFTYSSLLMWNFFNKTINYSVKLVRNNKDIISKVYVPKFILLFSNMILNFIKLLFSLIVLIPMLIIFRVHITWTVIWVLPAYLVLILLSFGVGMIFLHFGVYVDDLSYAVGIVLNMLMFLSGIFYDVMTTLDAPLSGMMMTLNPVAMVVDTMRNALLYGTIANVPQIILWTVASAMLCCVGVHIVYKNENAYVKIV